VQAPAARVRWRALLLLALSLPLLALCCGIYAHALPRWLHGASQCRQCFARYALWLEEPRANGRGLDCAAPQHLAAVPAGVQTLAGVAVRSTRFVVAAAHTH